ncbi:hypothetical protein [Shouchella rhizosphaerae]|uniref:Lipoprotein n=1 Tax=Shouchella rhizosphaerae TaxID=866786 RepID=A0ABZ2CT46_9BACI
MKKLLTATLLGAALLTACSAQADEKDVTIDALATEINEQAAEIEYLKSHRVYVEYELVDITTDDRGLTQYTLKAVDEAVIYDDDMPEGAEVGQRYRFEVDPSGDDVVDGITAVELID